MSNTMNLPAGRHINLEHQYGCAATMTIAYFVMFGIVHVARRLVRADLTTSGKIEIYTVASDRCVDGFISAFGEDWLGYADEFNPTKAHAAAMCAIAAVEGSAYAVRGVAMDQAARTAALELS